jgi:putative redox protein
VAQTGPATSRGTVRDHAVLIDRPESKGGADAGAMGGELLLVALGGCFMSTLLAAIKAREAAVSNVNAAVDGTLEGKPSRFTAVTMTVTAEAADREQLQKLVTIAERTCIVANTLKDAVALSVVVG